MKCSYCESSSYNSNCANCIAVRLTGLPGSPGYSVDDLAVAVADAYHKSAYYHRTARSNVPSIRRTGGLDPNKGGGYGGVGQTMGGPIGSIAAQASVGWVHMTRPGHGTHSDRYQETLGSNTVQLQAFPNGLLLQPDPLDPTAVRTRQLVPYPANLRVRGEPGTPEFRAQRAAAIRTRLPAQLQPSITDAEIETLRVIGYDDELHSDSDAGSPPPSPRLEAHCPNTSGGVRCGQTCNRRFPPPGWIVKSTNDVYKAYCSRACWERAS